AFGAAAKAADAPKPNILFIFADDLAFDCIGAYGNSEVQTPNLDRLAKRGTRFRQTYNMGGWGGAICVASRTMLNTGLSLWRANKVQKELTDTFVARKQMWSQLLAAAGYRTYMTGKWHISAKPADVFRTAVNVRGGMPINHDSDGYNRPQSPDDKHWLPWDTKWGGYWGPGKHMSEIVADDAEYFLKDNSYSPHPFFMYVAFNAPHDPRQAPEEFVDRYPPEKVSLPKPFLPEHPFDIGSNRIRDERLCPFPRTEFNVKVNRGEYYAIISHMDEQIGRILDSLKKSGKANNTWIFFTADHGLSVGHHGLVGKQNMYDHSMRVPFIVAGPDVPQDHVIDTPIYLQDVMPTSLELAGIQQPEHVEFKSLMPLIRGERHQPYASIYGAYMDFQRMIVREDDKLIVYPQAERKQLFNLKDDPWETTDQSDDPKQAALIESLAQELRAQQRQLGDDLQL
ncbi:MAG: sulfatase-like hydrolase/transferase, partial [Planctomycetaceae bacterium]|nr:sulfatase-like hydrolase/transferase [Planctomycetaceae bacterium]